MKTPTEKLWFTENYEQAYLLPFKYVPIPGIDKIFDFEGNTRFANLDKLARFAVAEEAVHEYLKREWEAAMQTAKSTWMQLHAYTQARKPESTELGATFAEGLAKGGLDLNQAAEMAAAAFGQKDPKNPGKEQPPEPLKALFGEQDKNDVVKAIFNQIKMIAGDPEMSDKDLQQDPKKWVDKLYKRFFGAEDAKRKAENTKKIRDEVRESIAEGLRRVGMTPSADMDPEDGK